MLRFLTAIAALYPFSIHADIAACQKKAYEAVQQCEQAISGARASTGAMGAQIGSAYQGGNGGNARMGNSLAGATQQAASEWNRAAAGCQTAKPKCSESCQSGQVKPEEQERAANYRRACENSITSNFTNAQTAAANSTADAGAAAASAGRSVQDGGGEIKSSAGSQYQDQVIDRNPSGVDPNLVQQVGYGDDVKVNVEIMGPGTYKTFETTFGEARILKQNLGNNAGPYKMYIYGK